MTLLDGIELAGDQMRRNTPQVVANESGKVLEIQSKDPLPGQAKKRQEFS
jgi:hypothetical protein